MSDPLRKRPDGRRFQLHPDADAPGETCEVDETNAPSNALVKRLAATRIGGTIELHRPS